VEENISATPEVGTLGSTAQLDHGLVWFLKRSYTEIDLYGRVDVPVRKGVNFSTIPPRNI
jgi:hypothetical protein